MKKPLTPYDIIYEIKYFDIGESAFTFGNVDLFKLDAERLVKMRLIKNTSVVKDTVFGEWVGKSVIKTEVSISELDRAYESGLNTVSNVLDAIRLVAVWGRLNKLNGELFLWELGKSMTIPKEVNYEGMVVRTTYHRGFRPLIIPMDETIKKGLNDQKAWNHLFDESLPEDIYTCLSRAIKWITQAVTTNGLDFKIVYLCTALEIMLLPEYKKPPKGARLALRHVLLGHGNGLTPEAVLHLYDKRSSIIHDGSLEITDYSAYLNLLICCFEVFHNIINLSKHNPSVQKIIDLLKITENAESLQDFIRSCERGIYDSEGIKNVKKLADNRLKELLREN